MKEQLHIVSFSTGLSSALTAERVFQKYPVDQVVIVFMDTLVEDSDNYRFADEVRSHWREVYGAERFVDLEEGRTPLEVSEDKQIIPNQKIAPCTFVLKVEPFKRWLETVSHPATIHIGFDYTEVHRCDSVQRNYGELGFDVDFPLLWKPIEFRPYEEVSRADWGIEPPRMYRMGYTHANCGGCCVKQGQGDWLRTLINFPERFAKYEAWEERMRGEDKYSSYAFLRDFRGGDVTPMTLRQLRERHKEERSLNGQGQLDLFMREADADAGCVQCGIGSFWEEEEGEKK